MRCDSIPKSGKDRFRHTGGERGQIRLAVGKKKIPHRSSRRKRFTDQFPVMIAAALPADGYGADAAVQKRERLNVFQT